MCEYNNYTNYIKSFVGSNIEEWTFKSNGNYTSILEHVSIDQGNAYLNEIINRFNSFYNENKEYLIELSHINDYYGNTTKSIITDFTNCSPTNIRYILHSLLILTYMNECMLTDIDIIEIGGGYGGLCFFIKKLSGLFNINIISYTIFDLPEPLMLQNKYLKVLKIENVNFAEINNFNNIKENSFLISNYAFSEIPLELQKEYTDKLLNPYVSHGFLTWNWIDMYKFIDNKNIISEIEFPKTSTTATPTNYYVRFKPI
jgi:hypothetical protein